MTKKQTLAVIRLTTFSVVLILAALGIVDLSELSQVATPQPPPLPTASIQPSSTSSAEQSGELYPVTSVTDGDTFKIMINDKKETVRLVGINTPETVDPRKPVECFGRQASDALKQLLAGQTVRLESDPTQSDRDRYGRLLRFAFLPDGTDVGLWLLENGYAQESLYSDVPHRYRDVYVEAEQVAKTKQAGFWNPNVCNP